MIPATLAEYKDWGVPKGMMLGDENFKSLNSIDILLGDDVFFEVLLHDKDVARKPSSFTGYRTRIISGKITLAAPEQAPRQSFFIHNKDNLEQQLQKFREIEELTNKARRT
jgi:hypothetical protein